MTSFVVLMCHGKQARMGDYTGYKQLVPVQGEPCVQRTGRLLREMQRSMVLRIVAPEDAEWAAVARVLGAQLMPTTDPLFLAALPGVIPTVANGWDRVLVLCGDVVFSPEILRSLLDSKAPVAFAGRFVPNIYTGRTAGELYGFSIDGHFLVSFLSRVQEMIDGLGVMRAQLESVLTDPDQIGSVMENNLRLWLLMHSLEDAGMAEVVSCAWTDYIDDIDGPDDLARLPRIEEVIARRALVTKALEARD